MADPVSSPGPGDRVTDRVMRGETPLQALARQPRTEVATALRSLERFPYYTAFPFAWYRACHAADLPRGGVRPLRYLDRDGVAHDEIKRGLTAGTFQHELDHLDGVLFLDRVTDPTTFTTWEQFERFHRAAFVERITEFVRRVGS